MADVHSEATRSFNMSRIKGKDTKPEMVVRSYLFRQGFRFRKNDSRYPGSPDIVLPKYQTIVFVNGCFWHGHKDCKYFVLPKTNTVFWKTKIERNIERDQVNCSLLAQMGWHVIVLWECELKPKIRAATLDKLVEDILHQS